MTSLLPKSCLGCPLSTNTMCGKFTSVEGKGALGVLVIAEASGEHEAAAGLPLRPHAPSGSVFEKAIRRLGYTREHFWITNILRCRPPRDWLEGAPWEEGAIAKCAPNLREVVETVKPRAILGLGGIPLRELTGFEGKKLNVSYLRGYALPSRYGIPHVPTFDPAYIARGNSKLIGLFMEDIGKAVAISQGQHPGPVMNPHSMLTAYGSMEKLRELYSQAKENPAWPIAYDTETTTSEEKHEDEILEYSRDGEEEGEGAEEFSKGALDTFSASIRTVQFALNDKEGVSVPFEGEFIGLIKLILGLPNPKLSHNGTWFDRPVLERHGVRIEGVEYDTMLMARVLSPDEPAHLQSVAGESGWLWPWKHYSGSDITFYGVADVCALHVIYPQLRAKLESRGSWTVYETLTRRFRSEVIAPMERRGLPISREKLDELRTSLQSQVFSLKEQLSGSIPDSFNTYSPYSNLPGMIKEFVLSRHVDFFAPETKTFKNGSQKEVKSKLKVKDLYQALLSDPSFRDTLAEVLNRWPELRLREGKLQYFEPFNPGSSKQLLAYLKHKRYPIPKRFKDGKETTSDKEMLRLETKTKDPVIRLGREIRTLDKMVGSYTGRKMEDGSIKGGWVPGPDGRLRPTITFKSTGQLASSNPNVMTLPVRREDLAESFRRVIAAEPGHVIAELDMMAFHAKTTGLAASDAQYMELAGMDIHSYVAGWLVKDSRMEDFWSYSKEDKLALLGEIKTLHKKVRNVQAKPAILGIGFGMGYKRLYFENRDYFASEAEAKKLLDLVKSLFPKVFQWQQDIVDLADRQGYIQNSFGRRRWFWDAKVWKLDRNAKWEHVNGPDAEKIKAFLPASNAHDLLRSKLMTMVDLGYTTRYNLINIVHDSTLWHLPEKLVDEAIPNIARVMNSPTIELAHSELCPGGFQCDVDASYGPTWGKKDQKEFKWR